MEFNSHQIISLPRDQPKAIEKARSKGPKLAMKPQVLLGLTGSGRTFTVANVSPEDAKNQRDPNHNKGPLQLTLWRIKQFFPEMVEYFSSYSRLPISRRSLSQELCETYIEKDSRTMKRFRKSFDWCLFLLAYRAKDVDRRRSVSCIYGIREFLRKFAKNIIKLKVGDRIPRNQLLFKFASYSLQ